jgi:hypothetical protein
MNTTLPRTNCKGCGRPIIFARNTQTGALMPLDANVPVFHARDYNGEIICAPIDAMVSHFSTCAKASEFSKKATT